MQADEPARPRLDGCRPQNPQPHRMLARSDVGHVGTPAGDRMVEGGQHRQLGIDGVGGVPLPGPHQGVSPGHVPVARSDEVDRHPVAGADLVALLVQALEGSHPHGAPGRKQGQGVVGGQPPAGQGSGHHRARALDGEGPIHPQPGPAAIGCGGCERQQAVQLGDEVADAGPGHRVGGHDRRIGQEGARDVL